MKCAEIRIIVGRCHLQFRSQAIHRYGYTIYWFLDLYQKQFYAGKKSVFDWNNTAIGIRVSPV